MLYRSLLEKSSVEILFLLWQEIAGGRNLARDALHGKTPVQKAM